jgi:hypothetical protein
MKYVDDIYGSDFSEGTVEVIFGRKDNPDTYTVHGIREIGEPSDNEGGYSMWSWINHLRHKIWWNEILEEKLINEVKKYL